MDRFEHELVSVKAELRVPLATAHLVQYLTEGPYSDVMHEQEAYWLDLSLTPRPRHARACYHRHWHPQRFERLGETFFLPPGETFLCKGDARYSQESILCLLSPQLIRDWLDRDLSWTGEKLEASLNLASPEVNSLLRRLAHELQYPGFATESLVELIAGQLAVELGRCWNSHGTVSRPGGLSTWRLRLIDERLKEISKPPTLAELASLCKLSVRQLTRSFRVSRGCSISTYIANGRLEHAKQLLASDMSIKTIAYTLGFASPSNFCSAFRRARLGTPTQFKRNLDKR